VFYYCVRCTEEYLCFRSSIFHPLCKSLLMKAFNMVVKTSSLIFLHQLTISHMISPFRLPVALTERGGKYR
jgi:hypothetical protein